MVVGVANTVSRRGHAVEQTEDLELRFELVGHTVDRQVGFADGILNRGDEGHCRDRLGTQLTPQGLARMMQIGRHHIFK